MTIRKEMYQQLKNISLFEEGIIPKKYQLGNRQLECMVVPCNVVKLCDWAFAHCKNLRKVWVPRTLTTIGQGVFEGCRQLEQIVVYEEKENSCDKQGILVYEKEEKLLAQAVAFLPPKRALDFEELGTETWYRNLDADILRYLEEPDAEGFEPFLAGGEEDYGVPENHFDTYCFLKQQAKCRLLLTRLDNGLWIRETARVRYIEYLCEKQQALLAVVLGMRERAYFAVKLCTEMGILSANNADYYLDAMEELHFGEARAYLLGKKEEWNKESCVWESFEL